MSEHFYDLVLLGNIVTPQAIIYDGALAVHQGKIAGIWERPSGEIKAKETIDAKGRFILPGAVDAHVHCYSSPQEGFVTAGRAAAAGGVTTIIEMPYDAPGMIGTEEVFLAKREHLAQEAMVDMALLATIKPDDDGLTQIPRMASQGACGFKVSMFNTDSVRFPRIHDGLLYDVFAEVAKTGRPVGVHAENDEMVRHFIKKYESMGGADPRAHAWSRPKLAEAAAALTALELAYWTGVHLHIYHCSFPRIFDFVQLYRNMGTKVTAETCTHYLTLSEDDMLTLGAKVKINPPLRSKADVAGLWKQLADGMIDIVTSDHAPWTLDRKNKPDIFANASGAPGVETLLPIMYSEGVAKGRITLLELVRMICEKPADIFGLAARKGKLAAGLDADLVVLDPNETWVLDEQKQHSSAGWSPYHHKVMQGKITHTFVRGKLVYDGAEVVGRPGDGQFVPASFPGQAAGGNEVKP